MKILDGLQKLIDDKQRMIEEINKDEDFNVYFTRLKQKLELVTG